MEREVRQALAAAYRLLARRDRSEQELRTALDKRETAAENIEAVIEHLRGHRLVDDRKFAAQWAQSLKRNKKVGPRYVRDALKKKGVPSRFIDEALAATYATAEDEREELRTLIAKKDKTLKKTLSPLQRKKRLYDFLVRRGFSHGAVMGVLGAGPEDE